MDLGVRCGCHNKDIDYLYENARFSACLYLNERRREENSVCVCLGGSGWGIYAMLSTVLHSVLQST